MIDFCCKILYKICRKVWILLFPMIILYLRFWMCRRQYAIEMWPLFVPMEHSSPIVLYWPQYFRCSKMFWTLLIQHSIPFLTWIMSTVTTNLKLQTLMWTRSIIVIETPNVGVPDQMCEIYLFFQSRKRLYIHKCPSVRSFVRLLVTETLQQLEIIIFHHSSFNLHHSSFILHHSTFISRLLSFSACYIKDRRLLLTTKVRETPVIAAIIVCNWQTDRNS